MLLAIKAVRGQLKMLKEAIDYCEIKRIMPTSLKLQLKILLSQVYVKRISGGKNQCIQIQLEPMSKCSSAQNVIKMVIHNATYICHIFHHQKIRTDIFELRRRCLTK